MSLANVEAGGIDRWLRRGIALVCAVLLLAMMGLTIADVLGRYLFNSPVPGASELTELILAAVIFTGLPAASLDGDHISVDIVAEKLHGLPAVLLSRLVALVSASVLAMVSWRLWIIGDQIASYNGITPTLKLPLAPLGYLVSVLSMIAALICLADIFRRKDLG
jgi:TRAP-type C4-dicarboxylate transport system permease small subunit